MTFNLEEREFLIAQIPAYRTILRSGSVAAEHAFHRQVQDAWVQAFIDDAGNRYTLSYRQRKVRTKILWLSNES